MAICFFVLTVILSLILFPFMDGIWMFITRSLRFLLVSDLIRPDNVKQANKLCHFFGDSPVFTHLLSKKQAKVLIDILSKGDVSRYMHSVIGPGIGSSNLNSRTTFGHVITYIALLNRFPDLLSYIEDSLIAQREYRVNCIIDFCMIAEANCKHKFSFARFLAALSQEADSYAAKRFIDTFWENEEVQTLAAIM